MKKMLTVSLSLIQRLSIFVSIFWYPYALSSDAMKFSGIGSLEYARAIGQTNQDFGSKHFLALVQDEINSVVKKTSWKSRFLLTISPNTVRGVGEDCGYIRSLFEPLYGRALDENCNPLFIRVSEESTDLQPSPALMLLRASYLAAAIQKAERILNRELHRELHKDEIVFNRTYGYPYSTDPEKQLFADVYQDFPQVCLAALSIKNSSNHCQFTDPDSKTEIYLKELFWPIFRISPDYSRRFNQSCFASKNYQMVLKSADGLYFSMEGMLTSSIYNESPLKSNLPPIASMRVRVQEQISMDENRLKNYLKSISVCDEFRAILR